MLIQPGLIASISGRLGEEVYSRTRNGITVRAKGIVDQPETPAHTITATRMKDAVNNWKANLSEEQRLEWNLYARQFPLPKRMSGTRYLTGYTMFLSRSFNWDLIGFAPAFGPYDYESFFGDSHQVQALSSFSISPEGSGTKLFLYGIANGVGGPTDGVIEATPCVTPGTRYVKNLWRVINAVDPLDGFNAGDYASAYETVFGGGSLIVGKEVHVRIIPVAQCHGNRGPFTEATAIVT